MCGAKVQREAFAELALHARIQDAQLGMHTQILLRSEVSQKEDNVLQGRGGRNDFRARVW